MATRKKDVSSGAKASGSPAAAAQNTAAYEQLVQDYAAAVELLHNKDYAAARAGFERVVGACAEEPALGERSRTYLRLCDAKLAPAQPEPSTSEERYHRAVVLINDGEPDPAIAHLDKALVDEPGSARLLYARATAWALKGSTESAVNDLRQAIGSDPQARFQAVNDPDFEKIREEPAFIDIIEPTPTGA